MSTKTYSQVIRFKTFEERFLYLQDGLKNQVGSDTFGHSRYLNQQFYRSREWKQIRDRAIIRDFGSDLAMGEDYEIFDMIIVHHIIPITEEMIINNDPLLYDLENLICMSDATHKALHYGDISMLASPDPIIRMPNDMAPWKH